MVQTIALQNTLVPDIAETCRAAINAHRAEAERLRRLPDPLVAALRDTRAFALLTPADRGGLELSLGATCEVYESIARIDGDRTKRTPISRLAPGASVIELGSFHCSAPFHSRSAKPRLATIQL